MPKRESASEIRSATCTDPCRPAGGNDSPPLRRQPYSGLPPHRGRWRSRTAQGWNAATSRAPGSYVPAEHRMGNRKGVTAAREFRTSMRSQFGRRRREGGCNDRRECLRSREMTPGEVRGRSARRQEVWAAYRRKLWAGSRGASSLSRCRLSAPGRDSWQRKPGRGMDAPDLTKV